MVLTDEQRTELHAAIDNASGYGECSYQAGCVVAQLFLGRGAPLPPVSIDGKGVEYLCTSITTPIGDFPARLLEKLQAIWDRQDVECDDMEARKIMHKLVNDCPARTDHDSQHSTE